jgi:hypothetical protein
MIKMSEQLELGSSNAMGLNPKFLIAPKALYGSVYPILTPAAGESNTVATADQSLGLQGIFPPNWTNLTNGVFMMADPMDCTGIVRIYLDGVEEPTLVPEAVNASENFTTKKIRFRGEHHYKSGWVDHRAAWAATRS